jgi:hypothetical protein
MNIPRSILTNCQCLLLRLISRYSGQERATGDETEGLRPCAALICPAVDFALDGIWTILLVAILRDFEDRFNPRAK